MRVDATGPSIEDLRTFLLLAELAGVAEVARRLGIDDSVVSRRLRPFRVRFGLVRKRGGSLVLSDRGRELLPTVRALVNEYDGLASALANRPSAEDRALSIAVGSFGAVALMPEVVARFLRDHPGRTVRTRVCRGRERVQGVADGRFDLAVASHSLEQVRAVLGDLPVSLDRLAEQPFAVVARRGTPTGDRLGTVPASGSVTVHDLARFPIVGPDETSGVRTQLERQAADAGITLQFGPSAGGWLAAKEYARHGLGAGITPFALLTDEDPRDLVVRALARPLWPSVMLLHRSTDLARIEALKEVIRSTAMDQAQRQQERVRLLTEGDRLSGSA